MYCCVCCVILNLVIGVNELRRGSLSAKLKGATKVVPIISTMEGVHIGHGSGIFKTWPGQGLWGTEVP